MMLKVRPTRMDMLESGKAVRLTLVSEDSPQTYHLDLPVAEAQRLALEINGLAADRCGEHHIGPVIAHAVGLRFEALEMTMIEGGWMSAHLALKPDGAGKAEKPVMAAADVTAALSLAIHMGLPIFVKDHLSEGDAPRRPLKDHKSEHTASRQIPTVFHEAIQSVEWPEDDE